MIQDFDKLHVVLQDVTTPTQKTTCQVAVPNFDRLGEPRRRGVKLD